MSADCADCATANRRGYCAPARCYCGHESCHAFESFIPLSAIPLEEVKSSPRRRHQSSWDTREESTWIDQL